MAKKKVPGQLETIWTEDIEKTFHALVPKHQQLLLAYIDSNYEGATAYREVYCKTAKDDTAYSGASRVLRSDKVERILQALSKNNAEVLLDIDQTYQKAMRANKPVFKDGDMVMEVEDHPTRINAAEKRAKLHQLLTDKQDITHNFPKAIEVTFKKPTMKVPRN